MTALEMSELPLCERRKSVRWYEPGRQEVGHYVKRDVRENQLGDFGWVGPMNVERDLRLVVDFKWSRFRRHADVPVEVVGYDKRPPGGAGLKLDRRIGWRSWEVTWRLLGIAMPLTIVGIGGLAWFLLGIPAASALLIGAALAPTDPVLASDVQVGPPRAGEEDDVRFSLTSEAGLNDGLSFPFVYLAIATAADSSFDGALL